MTSAINSLSLKTAYDINITKSLENCLSEIIKNHFNFSYTVLFTVKNFDAAHILKHIPATIINIEQPKIIESLKFKVNQFIFTYNDISQLNTTFSILKQSYCFDSRAKYLIISQSFDHNDKIAQILWTHRLYRSIIITQKNGTVINLYEIDFEKSKCGTAIRSKKIDRWNHKFNYKIFEPDLAKHFHNCTLKVIYADAPPWVEKDITGVFVRVIETFAQINGFQLLYRPENPIYLLELRSSYSFNAVEKDFKSGYADIFLGLGNNLPHFIMETTSTVYDDNLYWAVPKASRMPYWKATFHWIPPLSTLFVILFFGIVTTLFCIIAYRDYSQTDPERRYRDFVANFLLIFAACINFSSGRILPRSVSLRTIYIIASFIFLLTFIVLQGRLYDILSNPIYENDITDLDKMLESGLPMVINEGTSVLFLFMGPQNQRVFDTYIPTNWSLLDSLDKLIREKNFATIIDTGCLIMRPTPKAKRSYNIFDIAYFQTCVYMRKYHELFEILNADTMNMVEMGFVEKFVSDTRWKYYLEQEPIRETSGDGDFFKFSFSHMEMAFYSLAVWFSLAILVLFGEILFAFLCKRR